MKINIKEEQQWQQMKQEYKQDIKKW